MKKELIQIIEAKAKEHKLSAALLMSFVETESGGVRAAGGGGRLEFSRERLGCRADGPLRLHEFHAHGARGGPADCRGESAARGYVGIPRAADRRRPCGRRRALADSLGSPTRRLARSSNGRSEVVHASAGVRRRRSSSSSLKCS